MVNETLFCMQINTFEEIPEGNNRENYHMLGFWRFVEREVSYNVACGNAKICILHIRQTWEFVVIRRGGNGQRVVLDG